MARPVIATRERILSGALARFARYGFRRTSMEDIASEAAISRAALYLQFRNKEGIFRALAEKLHQEALGRAARALDGDGSLPDRVRTAIEGKSLGFVEIAYQSPHGDELLDESNRLCGDVAAAAERRFHALLARALRRAAAAGEVNLAAAGLGPTEAAELLARAVAGLKGPGVTVESYRRRLAALVRIYLAGMGARTRRTPGRPAAARSRAS